MAISKQCVILVGGLGTRLGHLTAHCPKPLLPVGEQPFLDFLILQFARFGFVEFVLLSGYLHETVVERYGPDGTFTEQHPSLRFEIVVEEVPMGTGGALYNARHVLDDEFLLVNGDSFFDFNIIDLATFQSSGDWLLRMALREVDESARYGSVAISGDTVTRFGGNEADGPALVNTGVYYVKRELVSVLEQGSSSLEQDIFPRLIEQQALSAKVYVGDFLDIGLPEDFARGSQFVRGVRRRPAVFFDRDGTLNEDAGYTHKIEDFKWMDGAPEAIRLLNDIGFYVFVVTNQAGVARGYYPESAVMELHQWMNDQLRSEGAHIDDIRFCPFHPDGSVERYARKSSCRKPAPGMIVSLLADWNVDTERSFLIGDTDADCQAASAAGLACFKPKRGESLLEAVRAGLVAVAAQSADADAGAPERLPFGRC